MDVVWELLAREPLLLLFTLLALGTAAGTVRLAGISLGPSAVLFTGIAVSAAAAGAGVALTVPPGIGDLGLCLFTYTIGVLSGPSFFGGLRRGARTVGSVVAVVVAAAGVAALVGAALGLSRAVVAGTFAGALTNTPALAAAGERAGDAAAPAVGYSVAYLGGVVGMLVAAAAALRRDGSPDDAPKPLTQLTVRVERDDGPTVSQVTAGREVVVSRVARGDRAAVQVARPDVTLRRGDLVTLVGPEDVVAATARELGHPSSHTLVRDRRAVDMRRITLSRAELAGRTVAELGLEDRFGATVSRVRRGDVDMVAVPELVLQPGDRLRVIAAADRLGEVSRYLGDSIRGLSDVNPLGLALGMTAGLLLGEVHLPLPGGGFAIGAAAGTLLVGLVLGRLGRVGPLVTTVPHAAASAISQLGMLVFLAYAGTRAGAQFLPAFGSGQAWRIALTGALTTAFFAVALLVVLTRVHRSGGVRNAGIVAGAQTQPAILAFANERTAFDTRVAVAYALVYPAAMITKIVLAQLLAGG